MIQLDEPEYIYTTGPKIKCRECVEQKSYFWEQAVYKQHLKQDHRRACGRRGKANMQGSGYGVEAL